MEQNITKVIALLIDAENISPQYLKIILDEVSLSGTPVYKRIYGDWTSLDMVGWKKLLLENSLTPIQQFSYTQGKNATDSAMIIDAMDILYTKNVDGFCLVSSDSDFTRLAARLRESRMFVIGMGESKTPTAFKAACDTFKYLDVLMGLKDHPQEKNIQKRKHAQAKNNIKKAKGKKMICNPQLQEPQQAAFLPLEELIEKISELIDYHSDEDGFMALARIGDLLSRIYTDFDTRNYGFAKLHKLIEAMEVFEIQSENTPSGGKKLVVRNLF